MENIRNTKGFKNLKFKNLTSTQFEREGETAYGRASSARLKDNELKIEIKCEAKDSCRFNKNICLVGMVAMTEAIESGIYDSDL